MKWRIQFFLLVAVMGAFVLGGIHLAERGIKRVDGFTNGPVQSFQIARQENGRLEMTVFGRQFSFYQNPEAFTADTPSGTPHNGRMDWPGIIERYVDSWVTAISKTWKDKF